MISGTDARPKAITGVPLAIASMSARPNGSGQSIGKSSHCIAKESPLVAVANLADVLDQRILEQRLDPGLVIRTIDFVDLCRHRQRQSGVVCDLDGPIRSFLWADSANKRKIAPITTARSVQTLR